MAMHGEKYILALDQGTTSSRAILFDKGGRAVASSQAEFPQLFPKPGWVEQRGADIWQSQRSVVLDVLEQAGASCREVAALGITNQRETTLVWDRHTGEPIHNAIVWQCRRTAGECLKMKDEGMGDYISKTTGLVIDPYFSATKLKWILDNVDGARRKAQKGDLLFGTVDTFLLWKLTDGKVHATDVTNAARTMLFDIERLRWDGELLSYFNIPKEMMPNVLASNAFFCQVGDSIPELRGVPIHAMAGDQQASLFGQGCFNVGDAKNTYGTGCFLLMNGGKKRMTSKNSLLTTIAWDIGDGPEYALEGSIFNAGAVIKWLRDGLGLIKTAAESEELAKTVDDTAGVYLVPAFTGMGAPYWDVFARGLAIGLTRGTTRAHIVRAALESMAYQTRDLIEAMQNDSGVVLCELKADGGASANDFLMQFQADILGKRVNRPQNVETTALGAALLAGLGRGLWQSREDIAKELEGGRVFNPSMPVSQREKLYVGWKRAVERSFNWERQ